MSSAGMAARPDRQAGAALRRYRHTGRSGPRAEPAPGFNVVCVDATSEQDIGRAFRGCVHRRRARAINDPTRLLRFAARHPGPGWRAHLASTPNPFSRKWYKQAFRNDGTAIANLDPRRLGRRRRRWRSGAAPAYGSRRITWSGATPPRSSPCIAWCGASRRSVVVPGFPCMNSHEAPGSILVINVSRIGDTLLATPAVKALAKGLARRRRMDVPRAPRARVQDHAALCRSSRAAGADGEASRPLWSGGSAARGCDLARRAGLHDRPLSIAYALARGAARRSPSARAMRRWTRELLPRPWSGRQFRSAARGADPVAPDAGAGRVPDAEPAASPTQ